MEIIKNNKTNVFANDVESSLNIDLSTKVRLLPNEDISRTLSLNEQYNKERDNCDLFRLILAINPICSNVLYNTKTEIVINEGSDDVKVICDCVEGSQKKMDVAVSATNTTSAITYLDAIQNTEYSHPKLGNFTYHCGVDIFNNHMLRNDGFVHVNKMSNKSENSHGTEYNTIRDYSRNDTGDVIEQKIDVRADNKEATKMHLYRYDSIVSMKTAFYEKCEEKDGWWGFINPSNINIPNRDDENVLTNTLIASKKPCDFIDLYPDRSLYSFIPKLNQHRNRLEKNWDYCLTYPYKNDYEMINTICGANNYSIKVEFIKKNNTNGIEVLECYSLFKHNLKPSDKINIYYKNGQFQKFGKSIRIESVGDSNGDFADKIFVIKYADIISIYASLIENNNTFYFKRLNGSDECRYYFRKFKKLKNINGEDLKSDINKIAFSKNIYGDDVAQIIFTDDIDVSNLLDNNNRPVSEIYLTVIKRNAGHEIWYEHGFSEDSPKRGDTIEFSHCFGKVTSGLDFSGLKNEPIDYNIHKMHNLSFVNNEEFKKLFDSPNISDISIHYDPSENITGIVYKENGNDKNLDIKGNILEPLTEEEKRTFTMWGDSVYIKPKTIEDDITIDDEEFYADAVEYDVNTCKETIISNVYHRVNTAQRETFDKCFRDVLQDKIVYDDYDIKMPGDIEDKSFNVVTYYLNDVENADSVWNKASTMEDVIATMAGDKKLVYGNIMPEGNYYNPHTKIQIKSNSETISESPAKLINYSSEGFEINENIISLLYPTNYGFYKGDYIAFYDNIKNSTYWGEIINVDVSTRRLDISIGDDIELTKSNFIGTSRIYYAYWSPNNVPIYGNMLPKSRVFKWCTLKKQSELKSNDELYETTFSNGRLYLEKNINFFLRRQDPFGKYGLSSPLFNKIKKTVSNPMDDFIIGGDKQVDFSGIMYSINNFDNCY